MSKIQYICLIGLLVMCISANAQDRIEPLSSDVVKERLLTFSDRSVYSTGENILMNINYHNDMNDDFSDNLRYKWSRIIYVELVDAEGRAYVQEKIIRTGANTPCSLALPSSITSGVYYLKAYTKWMRNYGSKTYALSSLLVVNPRSKLKQSQGVVAESKLVYKKSSNISLTNVETSYSKRSKVQFSLISADDSCYVSVSVVPLGAKILNEQALSLYSLTPTNSIAEYYPDIYNTSVKGHVSSKNGNLKSQTSVCLSSFNAQSYFAGGYTDDEGDFFFAFPDKFSGEDYYIQARSGEALNITIDEGWCKDDLNIEKEGTVNDETLELANSIAVNTQLMQRFGALNALASLPEDSVYSSFYGKPDKVYNVKEYIDLPNVKEFVHELIPELHITYRRDTARISRAIGASGTYPVLVLLDNISIDNLNSVLKIPLSKVERVELVSSGYLSGEHRYGSIVHIITKEHRFAGIDLPHNSKFFSAKTAKNCPAECVEAPQQKRMPDRRNSLFWLPETLTTANSIQTLEFQTSDVAGEYQIIVQSISKETGEVFYNLSSFVVE